VSDPPSGLRADSLVLVLVCAIRNLPAINPDPKPPTPVRPLVDSAPIVRGSPSSGGHSDLHSQDSARPFRCNLSPVESCRPYPQFTVLNKKRRSSL
jgi:hypothetical protein